MPELRWAMTKLGDCMDEGAVDDMIKELDSDSKGHVDILEFAKVCFNIKEKKKKDWALMNFDSIIWYSLTNIQFYYSLASYF